MQISHPPSLQIIGVLVTHVGLGCIQQRPIKYVKCPCVRGVAVGVARDGWRGAGGGRVCAEEQTIKMKEGRQKHVLRQLRAIWCSTVMMHVYWDVHGRITVRIWMQRHLIPLERIQCYYTGKNWEL